MERLIKGLLAGAALASLAGCASYDYGYGYAYPQPYYGYYGYDGAPYYDDYGYPSYGPAYYYGAPSVGFSLGYSDYGHHDRYDRGHYDRQYRGHFDREGFDHDRASARQARPTQVNHAGNGRPNRPRTSSVGHRHAPSSPPAVHAQTRGQRRPAQETMRAEQ